VSDHKRWPGNVAAAAAGALVGALLVLGVDGLTRDPMPAPSPVYTTQPAAVMPTEPRPQRRDPTMLIWTPGRLPAGTVREVEKVHGVKRATSVETSPDWLQRSTDRTGALLDAPAAGMAIPFEVAAISPRDYALFVPPSDRHAIETLRPGEMVIPETGARLRGAAVGARFSLRDAGRLRVSAIVSDVATGGYEGLIRGPLSARSGINNFVLARLSRSGGKARARERVRRMLGSGHVLRTRGRGEQPFLRYGDAVLPQLTIKSVFGEFAARSQGDGTFVVDDRWRRLEIVTAHLPILGTVTCHRAMLPQLRAALREVRASGLAHLIDPSDYGGCFGPRTIDREPRGRPSHHAWGIAIDLNVSQNPFGAEPNQDLRLVRIMEAHGFTWGGRWLIPDGMHFEWVNFP
jgi:hypothetical protein